MSKEQHYAIIDRILPRGICEIYNIFNLEKMPKIVSFRVKFSIKEEGSALSFYQKLVPKYSRRVFFNYNCLKTKQNCQLTKSKTCVLNENIHKYFHFKVISFDTFKL